jgi:tetratricopeptide (TPR) repeat protein
MLSPHHIDAGRNRGKDNHRSVNRSIRMVLLLGALVGAAACNRLTRGQQAQKLLTQARQDAQAEKSNQAIIDYRRAIQSDPKLAVAHFELGQLYVQRLDYLNGMRQFSFVVESDPGNAPARLAIAEIFLLSQKYSDAGDQATAILKQAPGDLDATLMLARSLTGQNDWQAAMPLVSKVLEAQPGNGKAWLLLAGLQVEAKNYTASESSFRRALECDPKDIAAVAAYSALLLEQNRTSDAEKVIRQGVSNAPDNVGAQTLLGSFLVRTEKWQEAEAVFRRVAAMDEANPDQRLALAHFWITAHKPDLAEKEYLRIAAKFPNDPVSREELSALYLSNARLPEADKLLQSVLTLEPENGTALLLRGQLRLQQERVDDALVDLEHAVRTAPQSAQAHYYLAVAQTRKRDDRQAEGELRTALDLQPDFVSARSLLAGIELNSGELDKSLADLDGVVRSKPNTLDPYIARSILMAQKGKSAQAVQNLLPLLDQFPETSQRAITYRALAWIMFNQKKYEQARALLDRGGELRTNARDTFYLYAMTYVQERNSKAALNFVKQQLHSKPDWAEGHEVAGEICLHLGDYTEAESEFRAAANINPQMSLAWQGLGQAFAGESKDDSALQAFGTLLQLSPNSSPAYLGIARIHEKREEWGPAQNAYNKLLQVEPDNVLAKNNLAWDYAEHGGNVDVALRLAQDASQAVPDNPEICDTLGWIYLKQNSPRNAIEVLSKSVRMAPQNPEYNYHLGVAYLRNGDPDKAKQLLQTTIQLQPKSRYAEDAQTMLLAMKN